MYCAQFVCPLWNCVDHYAIVVGIEARPLVYSVHSRCDWTQLCNASRTCNNEKECPNVCFFIFISIFNFQLFFVCSYSNLENVDVVLHLFILQHSGDFFSLFLISESIPSFESRYIHTFVDLFFVMNFINNLHLKLILKNYFNLLNF